MRHALHSGQGEILAAVKSHGVEEKEVSQERCLRARYGDVGTCHLIAEHLEITVSLSTASGFKANLSRHWQRWTRTMTVL